MKAWRFWVGCGVSLLCLWLALRTVPLDELAGLVAGANTVWLLPAIALQLLGVVARARRWVILLRERDDRLTEAFWAQGIGYLFTNVLPFRMGEVARVVVVSDRWRRPVAEVSASVVVERLLDVGSVVALLVLVAPSMKVPDLVARAGMSFGVLLVLALGLVLFAARAGDRSEALLGAVCRRIRALPADRVVALWREAVAGLRPLTERRVLVPAVAWSVLIWALSVGTYWCVLRSFQPSARVAEAAFMVVALSLAITVPSSPGFLGVFQLVGQQALVLPFGAKYDAATALAITVTAYLIYYLLTTALGVVGLWQLGESFANLGRALRRQATRR